jgi:hypothetical protein
MSRAAALQSLGEGEEQGVHVLYCDGIVKWLAIQTVLGEMLTCKLLSTEAAGIKYLYFT